MYCDCEWELHKSKVQHFPNSFQIAFPLSRLRTGTSKKRKTQNGFRLLISHMFCKIFNPLWDRNISVYIFLECWAYLSKISSDAPVVRKAHATAILLLLLPKFYRCYLYYHMLQFQKLLIQVPHLLSQGSKWQTNNFWKLYYFFWQFVCQLLYIPSITDGVHRI